MLNTETADTLWDGAGFKMNFSINIRQMSDEQVQFEMKGIDPPLANAFRRILIAEVPTVAISEVTIFQNTGVIHDENLCHRFGLIPLVFDPDVLAWRTPGTDFDHTNSVTFKLQKKCPQGVEKVSVYSGDLVWAPSSDEEEAKYKANPPRPVATDILIAQLGPGQEIEVVCKCEKGFGKEHTKWTPLCTAIYRLVPEIVLTKPITGADAQRLKKIMEKERTAALAEEAAKAEEAEKPAAIVG